MQENYFLLLGLSFDPIETNEEVILKAIETKTLDWQKDSRNPKKAAKAKELLQNVDKIKEIMLNPVQREGEAHAALEVKKRKLKDAKYEILIKASKGFVKESELKAISDRYEQYGLKYEDIKKQCSAPIYSDELFAVVNGEQQTIDIIDESISSQLETYFDNLGYNHISIYELFEKAEDAPAHEMVEEAEKQLQHILQKGTKTTADGTMQKIAGLAKNIFSSEDERKKYDNYLSGCKYMILNRLIAEGAEGNEGTINAKLYSLLLSIICSDFEMEEDEAQKYIIANVRINGYKIDKEVLDSTIAPVDINIDDSEEEQTEEEYEDMSDVEEMDPSPPPPMPTAPNQGRISPNVGFPPFAAQAPPQSEDQYMFNGIPDPPQPTNNGYIPPGNQAYRSEPAPPGAANPIHVEKEAYTQTAAPGYGHGFIPPDTANPIYVGKEEPPQQEGQQPPVQSVIPPQKPESEMTQEEWLEYDGYKYLNTIYLKQTGEDLTAQNQEILDLCNEADNALNKAVYAEIVPSQSEMKILLFLMPVTAGAQALLRYVFSDILGSFFSMIVALVIIAEAVFWLRALYYFFKTYKMYKAYNKLHIYRGTYYKQCETEYVNKNLSELKTPKRVVGHIENLKKTGEEYIKSSKAEYNNFLRALSKQKGANKNFYFMLAIVASVVITILLAGGIWYLKTHSSSPRIKIF